MHAYTEHPAHKAQFTPFWASREALRGLTAERTEKPAEEGEEKEEKNDGETTTQPRRSSR